MSETATFCATCGAVVLAEPTPSVEAPPVSTTDVSLPADADDDWAPRHDRDDWVPIDTDDDWVAPRDTAVHNWEAVSADDVRDSLDVPPLAPGPTATALGPAAAPHSRLEKLTGKTLLIALGVVGGVVLLGVLAHASHSGPLLELSGLALSVVMPVITFVVMIACLFMATWLVGYNITVKQILGIAGICGLVSLIPGAGFLLALLVEFGLIMKWADCTLLDAIVIIVLNGFLVAWVFTVIVQGSRLFY